MRLNDETLFKCVADYLAYANVVVTVNYGSFASLDPNNVEVQNMGSRINDKLEIYALTVC